MEIKDIPLIVTNFNQLTYTQNLILWFRFHYPQNPVIIIDNGSDYQPLLAWYDKVQNIYVVKYSKNEYVNNLTDYLARNKYEMYVVSDPDIMPHPATPPNFLSYFKAVIDGGYHRCGFDLIYDDIPSWNPKQGWIQGDQRGLIAEQVDVSGYTAKKAPIDTTFCLYTSKNSGWHAPMNGKDWGDCLRLFQAYHLTWYLHKDYLNDEMKHYFSSVKKRDNSLPSAGFNHFNPYTGQE